MDNFSYEVYKSSKGYGYRVLNNGHAVLQQDIDPTFNGKHGMSEGRARSLAEGIVHEYANRKPPEPEKTELELLREQNAALMALLAQQEV